MSDLIFSGNGKEIAAALGHLSSSIGKNSTLPILSCYALSVDRGELIAKGTDLEVQHTIALPVTIEQHTPGAGACAAAGLLTGLLARCNGDGARVSLQGDTLEVASGGRKASMRVLPLAEFPAPHPPLDGWQKVDGAKLAASIDGVAFAASDDTTRYILNGIHITSDGLIVATDGKRLAQVKYTEDPPAALAGVIIPNKALGPITDLLERHAQVEVAGDEGGVCLRARGESFFTKRIEGNYPNFRQVIPRFTAPQRVSVERVALQKALAWAKLYRTTKDTTVKLYAAEGRLTIRVSSPEIGEAEEVLPMAEDATMQTAVNLTYLEQVVARDGGEQFMMEAEPDTHGHQVGTVNSPILIREQNEDFLGVLMPMRLM